MTLISTDNNKTKIVKMFFTMYLEQKDIEKHPRLFHIQEIYESEEHFDIENLYIK
jgi:Fur family ferric uptake transcriptional regulator